MKDKWKKHDVEGMHDKYKNEHYDVTNENVTSYNAVIDHVTTRQVKAAWCRGPGLFLSIYLPPVNGTSPNGQKFPIGEKIPNSKKKKT